MEKQEHNGNVSLSTIKMDKIYAIDGVTMGKNPSEMERQNVELNLDCAEDIEKIASMVMNTLKHGNKGKTDGSKNIKNEKMERIIRRIKEKLVIEKFEDELNKDKSNKGEEREENDEDREGNRRRDTPGEKGKDNTGKGDESDEDGEKDDPGNKENTKR